ncbi:high-affinity choline transporter 1-like [Amblyomma americanum]
MRFFVVASAMLVFAYTSLGGFDAVTYTDALQIFVTAVCLWICVPACLIHKAVGTVGPPLNDWIGTIGFPQVSPLLDRFLMTALGGIPWQVYFHRVLGCETDFDARMLSYLSALGCIAMAIPPVVIGAAAKSTNFTAAGYRGPYYLRDKDSVRVLPFSIRYLTSGLVSILGLLGITAAIMSSVDSSMLSASLLVTKNIYKSVVRPMASDAEVAFTLRMMVFLIGAWATYLALSVQSVFEMWSLCSDAVYVLLFPQLLCVLYFNQTNAYGSLMGFIVGCCLRWLFGVPALGLPVMVRLPLYDEELGQGFPVRLVSMGFGVVIILLGSYAAEKTFEKGWLPQRQDVFRCFQHGRYSREYQAASAMNVMGSALQAEAPVTGSAPHTRLASHSSRIGSEASMEDEAPNADNRDPLSTSSKASSLSRKSSNGDKMTTTRGSAVDLSRHRRASSVADMNKRRSASVGDLSRTVQEGAFAERRRRRHSSASLQLEPKPDSKADLSWHPMPSAKSELPPDAKAEVKPEGSQASVSQTPKKRRHMPRSHSKTSAAGVGGTSQSGATDQHSGEKAMKSSAAQESATKLTS